MEKSKKQKAAYQTISKNGMTYHQNYDIIVRKSVNENCGHGVSADSFSNLGIRLTWLQLSDLFFLPGRRMNRNYSPVGTADNSPAVYCRE